VMRHLSTLFRAGAIGGLPDRQLLEQFLTRRGEAAEAAFATLVERHGPMVLGVCRRALSDPHDADDAFQATFLILVRRAESVRVNDSLGRWLYGVSCRVASRARNNAGRRLSRECALVTAGERLATAEPADDRLDLRVVLDEELSRLPAKYREPLVLCYLQGQTHEGAARELGWPVGTVRGRMARARDLLRLRLVRRGLAPSAALLSATISSEARAAVPPVLIDSTVRAASRIAAGQAAATVVSAQVVVWAELGLTSMKMATWKGIAAALLIACTIGTGVVLVANRAQAERPLSGAPASAEPKGTPIHPDDGEELQGTWTTTAATNEVVNGVPKPARTVELMWVFTGDKISMADEQGFLDGEIRYTLDPTRTPKSIDLTYLDSGASFQGIYRLDGDELTLKYGRERPKDFEEGPEHHFHKLKRQSRRPVPVVSRFELAPGCQWAIAPGPKWSSVASNGIHAIVGKERDGGMSIIVAYLRKGGPDPGPECHPVVFDAQGKRHVPKSGEGGACGSAAVPGVMLHQMRYRLDPADLPADKVATFGIEAVPAEVRLAAREVASVKAVERARAEEVDFLPWPRVGEAYDFTVKTADGRVFRSRDLKGKVLLIDCWATWCSPCMAKMPKLKELYQKRHADGLEVLGMNFDNDQPKAREILKTLNLPWSEVFVPADEANRELWETAMGLESLPRLLVIDKGGVLRYDGGPDGIDEQVAKLLESPVSEPKR
jgi:RNA polymerase sigma factor (sigma-70 family)